MTKKTRPTYTPEFRLEAAKLVTEHDYSIREAMNVSKGSIEGWVARLRKWFILQYKKLQRNGQCQLEIGNQH